MTELRRRMDEDMVVRGMAERTREIVSVGGRRDWRGSIAGRPIRSRTTRCRRICVHLLRDRQRSWSTCNIVVARAAVLLSHDAEARPHDVRDSGAAPTGQSCPAILSREEVERVIAHATNPKHRTMLLTTYAAGLRLNEVLHLRVTDIDSARMTIRVEQGKGGKDRYTVLSAALARGAARVLDSSRARARGCFRRTATGQPMDPTALATGLPDGEAARGDHQARRDSRAPSRVCDAPARSRRRHPHDSTVARARLHHARRRATFN